MFIKTNSKATWTWSFLHDKILQYELNLILIKGYTFSPSGNFFQIYGHIFEILRVFKFIGIYSLQRIFYFDFFDYFL